MAEHGFSLEISVQILTPSLSASLRASLADIELGMQAARERTTFKMVSRRYSDEVVSIYYRCLCDVAFGYRFYACTSAKRGRAVVISNIELAPDVRGKGFLKALMHALSQPHVGLDAIEVENVLNGALAAHLQRMGAHPMSQGYEGGSWFLPLNETKFRIPHPPMATGGSFGV